MQLFGTSAPPDINRLKARRDVRGLLKALGYAPDATIRQGAARALGQLHAAPASEALIASLQDSEPPVRRDAAWALGQIGDPQATEPLIALLEDNHTEVHNAAAWALGQIGDPQAIDPLIAALRHWEEDVREAAFWALAHVGVNVPDGQQRHELHEQVAELLTDSHLRMRQTAAETLNSLGWKPGSDEHSARYWLAQGEWERCRTIGAPAVQPLIDMLNEPENETRQNAFTMLVELAQTAVEPLIAALGHSSNAVRQGTFWALVKIGPPAVDGLIAAVQTNEQAVIREACVHILGQMGDTRATEVLFSAFDDADWTVREAAATALARIGTAAVPLLVQALQSDSEDIRWRAATALERIGWQPDHSAAAASYWIARGEWKRCVALGEQAIKPLIAAIYHWDKDVRKGAAGALVRIGTPTLKPLVQVLGSDLPHARSSAAWALGHMHEPRLAGPLTRLLDDPEQDVRLAVIGALVRLHAPSEALILALKNDEPLVRKAAAWALGQQHDPRALGPLVHALQDEQADIRETATKALAALGDPRALEPLLALINDPDPQVRAAVGQATEHLYKLQAQNSPSA
jgi:HEAT repeat protein